MHKAFNRSNLKNLYSSWIYSKTVKNIKFVSFSTYMTRSINNSKQIQLNKFASRNFCSLDLKEKTIDIEPMTKIKIPFYCNIFTLANIMKVDMIELVDQFRETVQIELTDPLEYINKDDLELFFLENNIEFEVEDYQSMKVNRPMVVTIMGHVDHGKTTLLDTFRNSRLVDQEFGKITQTIGAFNIKLASGVELTFIDTPGHEAFSKMRQRGAKSTDLIILVISGIESVQKQTVEVLNIIKATKVPFIVAVNKVDRDQADPERVYKDLSELGFKVRQVGGKIPAVEISAKTKLNIDLLEKELSEVASTLDLSEETNIPAQAFVIESKTTQTSGSYVSSSASAIVKKGILREGDHFICGEDSYGRIKALVDDSGKNIKEAIPGRAVEIIGFKNSPQTGSILAVMPDQFIVENLISERNKLKHYNDSKAKEAINKGFKIGKLKWKERRVIMRGSGNKGLLKTKIENILAQKNVDVDEKMLREVYLLDDISKMKIILRADTSGMLEAIQDELLRNFDEQIIAEFIIKSSVGQIAEEEFRLAKSANAMFFTFNIDQEFEGFADIYKVGVRKHKLIYNIVEEIKHFIIQANLVDPAFEEGDTYKGRAEVKDIFKIKVNSKIL
jgi:translation initiation factor IF-2